ncbi:hypothetical protein CLV92_10831 [Kineococcus xinjiangensis]|uniref:Uncharacterized protein n=1 Tax=Kineococcus xinjiangensis TaxID=512762 RepID=A0A2S6IIT3_9ACTN|nr:hypothetical protein [Kineococcus xinjiangensis]PPK94133.1 hypothetical protein CLV92_10831 [Kineococcus xinjiangensis]
MEVPSTSGNGSTSGSALGAASSASGQQLAAQGSGVRVAGVGRPVGVRESKRAGTVTKTMFDHLTQADRELIEYATGEHIEPGYEDTPEQHVSPFARQIATDRQSAVRLPPGQAVTAEYLHDVSRQYVMANMEEWNPFAGEPMERALAYLLLNTEGRVDVTV